MKKISYITNISRKEISGGVSGVNDAIIKQLEKCFNVTSIIVIDEKEDLISMIISKFQKIFRLKRNYYFFSDRRLKNIARRFHKVADKNVDAYFFLGFTSWIEIKPLKPYYCINDVCFHTYVDIYNRKSEYQKDDLNRIYKKEKSWFKSADGVFFHSEWGRKSCQKNYNLEELNTKTVGIGGCVPIPAADSYQSGYNFLFISREFFPKGGEIAVKALNKVRMLYPEAVLWIVGEEPDSKILQNTNVFFKGFFNKKDDLQLKSLISLYKKAFALIHPTKKDTNPLVITEMAYFGGPSISSNKFAIPEFVLEAKTGYLLNTPDSPDELASKMIKLIEERDIYFDMRNTTRLNAIKNNTWDRVGERISNFMS